LQASEYFFDRCYFQYEQSTQDLCSQARLPLTVMPKQLIILSNNITFELLREGAKLVLVVALLNNDRELSE